MNAFLAALMLLTSIPVPKIEVSKIDWKKGPVNFSINRIVSWLPCYEATCEVVRN